jgi:hypothetical protein
MENLALSATRHHVWSVLQITFYKTVHAHATETDSLSLIDASLASKLMDWLAVHVLSTVACRAEPIINDTPMAIVYVRIQMCLNLCRGLVCALLVRTTRYLRLHLNFPQFQPMTPFKYHLSLFRLVHPFLFRFLSTIHSSN